MSEAKEELIPGKFCWNELITPDVEKAKAFYGQLFGWTFDSMTTEHGEYTFAKLGDNPAAGMMAIQAEWGEVPPHWMSYIAVEDVEKAVKDAEAAGGTVKAPVTQVGEMGKFAVIQDPTGAIFSFWEALCSQG